MKFIAPLLLSFCLFSAAYAAPQHSAGNRIIIRTNPSIAAIIKNYNANDARTIQTVYQNRAIPWNITQKIINQMQTSNMTLDDLSKYATPKLMSQLNELKLVFNTFQGQIKSLGSAAKLNASRFHRDYMLLEMVSGKQMARIFVVNQVVRNNEKYFFQFGYQAQPPYKVWKLVGLHYKIRPNR